MTPAVMPAEWAPHRATWIAWPHEESDWPGRFASIPFVITEVVRHLSRGEAVGILVLDSVMGRRVRTLLRQAGIDLRQVQIVQAPYDRSWTRDTGPIFVRDVHGRRLAVHWRFNGWANDSNHARDKTVGAAVARAARVPVVRPEMDGRWVVLEGGAIDVDGQGTLLATEECLLSRVQARNPGLGRRGTEDALRKFLGATRVIWLDRGIACDDTHGHIDNLARFVSPGRVALCRERNSKDANYRPLAENLERLRSARDARGRKIEVIPLPMPAPVVFDGLRVPASYANFYIANGRVIVPTFNDPQDRIALGLLAELFPGREVVGIHAVDLVWGLGTLHCLTQQEPA